MKLLITGSKGQLGNELSKILASGESELGRLPEQVQGCEVTAVDVDELDITDMAAVGAFLQKERPDVLINCAAMTNVNGCESSQDVAMKVNAIGARNLARSCEQIGCKLVHVSTDYVFAGDGDRPYVEWDICNPQSVYGTSKLLGEQYVRDFCTRYFIVRTAWLYGYVGGNFVKTISKLARERGEVTVVSDQRGNPTNAVDLAYHLVRLATTEEYGVYHCTGTGECSWYDFACEIIQLFGIDAKVKPCTTEEYPTPAKRPSYSSLDNMMLRCTIGDEMRDWKDALKAFVQHYEGEKS